MTAPASPAPDPSAARLGLAGRLVATFQSHALTPLLALVALLLGLFAVLVTPREEEPQIDVTMASVLIPFPGAGAADVQNLVARPAEQVLGQLAGIEHTFSVSRPGLAMVTVQFEVGVPRTEALVRVYDVLNANQDWLPRNLGAMTPIVRPQGIDDVPVLGVTLWADDARPAADLERIAHTLEAEIKRVRGTREVRTIGGPGRAVTVELDPARLRERGLDLARLSQTIAAASLALPAGRVVDTAPPTPDARRARLLTVETGEFLRSAEDVGALVVGAHQGRPVFLREVARVADGPAQPSRHVWFTPGAGAASVGAAGLAGTADAPAPAAGTVFPAVTLTVTKKPGTNAVDVSTAVRERIEALRGAVLPPGVHATVTRDYGATAADKAAKLIQKLAFATGSVILLVGLALGRREAVIVGAAVVLTLAATLFASWAWGFTLNRVSLFALIFSIGILVDDAIVVVENIHRHQAMDVSAQAHVAAGDVKDPSGSGRSQNTTDPAQAHVAAGDVKDAPASGRSRDTTHPRPLHVVIPQAVDEVGGPTILATFTVIAALLPMAFVSGLMGPYMSPIPINASLGMAISLVIAFTVTPWLALKLMKPTPAHGSGGGEPARGLAGRLQRVSAAVLGPLLRSARHRWLLLAGILAATVLSVGLAAVQWVVLKMLPFDNKSEFQLVVDLPAGTPLEDTAALLQALGTHLAAQPEVAHLQGYAGTASPITFNGLVRQYGLRADAEQGDLQVALVDKAHRHEQSHAIAQRLRPALDAIAAPWGARLRLVEVPPGPPVLSPIVAEVYGPDEAGRQQVAERLQQAFAATPDIVAVDSTLADDAPRAHLRIRRERAEALGIPVATVAQTVHAALSGADAAFLHDGASRYAVPVRLQLPRASQVGLDALLALPLRTADGRLVPLSELVRVERGVADKPLFTKDLQGVSYVFADVGAPGGGRAATLPDSPLYGLFALRPALDAAALPGTGALREHWIRQPANPYEAYAVKWDGEWQITYETFRDMGAAYGVGLILIYVLVVAQFAGSRRAAPSEPDPLGGRPATAGPGAAGAYGVPLVIMAPIPLTLIGVMPGHALLGAPFTATSMIGMIALAGIIVRNSILLVDFIDLQRAAGRPFESAVVEAVAVRAQPIGLTALAAMIGAFFILDDPIFNGLAISLIFGIGVSTLLTLVVIPVLYFAWFRPRPPHPRPRSSP